MNIFQLVALAVSSLSLVAMPACNGEVEETIDCQFSCQAYADCVDSDFDVSQCRKHCDENNKGEQADRCEKCVRGDQSCSEKTFQCADECAGIIIGL